MFIISIKQCSYRFFFFFFLVGKKNTVSIVDAKIAQILERLVIYIEIYVVFSSLPF